MFFFWLGENNQQVLRRPKPAPKFKNADMAEAYHKGIHALHHGRSDTNPASVIIRVVVAFLIAYYFISDDISLFEIIKFGLPVLMFVFLLGGLYTWLVSGIHVGLPFLICGFLMLWLMHHIPGEIDIEQKPLVETSHQIQQNKNLMQSKEYALCEESILATLPDSYADKSFRAMDINKIDNKKTRVTIHYNYINHYDQKIHRSSVCQIKNNKSSIVRTEFISIL